MCIKCGDCEFCLFPAVNYRDMPNGRICQYSYKRINHLKVRLRRFQAVESEKVPEKNVWYYKKRFAEKKNKVGWGLYYRTNAHPNKHNGNIEE